MLDSVVKPLEEDDGKHSSLVISIDDVVVYIERAARLHIAQFLI